MRPNTQAHVDAMLATIKDVQARDENASEDEWVEAFDLCEALCLFAHDAGEYVLYSRLTEEAQFTPHIFLRRTGEHNRGLTDEGMTIYRELLTMEGLT